MTHDSDPAADAPDRPGERRHERVGRDTDEQGSIHTGLLAVEWELTRTIDATLVTVHVTNTHSDAREVRIENRLDAPVDPPCRRGVPEAGWDDDGLTRRVPGATGLSIGYACRAPPETPPVAVTDRPTDSTGDGTEPPSPVDRALRSLGDHAPPRAVLSGGDEPSASDRDSSASSPPTTEWTSADSPDPPDSAGDETENETQAVPSNETSHPSSDASVAPVTSQSIASSTASSTASGTVPPTPSERASTSRPADAPASCPSAAESTPGPVTAWFHAVEARLDTADRLAGDVAEATPVVASLGGRAGVEELAETLVADAAALARVAARADELAARAEAAEVPDLEGSQ